jgi:tetratricopeptide (TPR) repeat protein
MARLTQILREALDAQTRHDWVLAASLYGSAELLEPIDHRLSTNLANVFWLADKPQQALAPMLRATALAPGEALPKRGLGNVLRDLNDFEGAVAAYEESFRSNSDPLTAWNLSQALIGLERYGEAFAVAEARLSLPEMRPYRSSPYLAAEPSLNSLANQGPLHVWSEQGFGDTLQYLRWVCVLCRHENQLCIEVESQLERLILEGLAWLPHPPQVAVKVGDGESPDPVDSPQGALMSLPHHLGGAPLTKDLFEADGQRGWQGYLRSPGWPICPRQAHPRVGLVWAAGRKLDDPFAAREYRKRTLPPETLAALIEGLHGQGAQLSNLQIGPDRDQAMPWADLFVDALPAQADFAATAAWIRQLDLLISVDTASAHLAGALGHPCWMLLPYSADPRWLRDRSDSPWYPSLRLFRQPQTGQWQPVIEQVLSAFRPWWQQASS